LRLRAFLSPFSAIRKFLSSQTHPVIFF